MNPTEPEILGLSCYPTLLDIPGTIDLVDVFRTSSAVPEIADQAIACKAKFLWLQLGVVHQAAAERAVQAGVRVIMDRCIKVDHARQA